VCVHRNDISDCELRDVDTQGALRSITGFDRDAQDAATDLIDEIGASGVRAVNDVDRLIENGQMDQSDVRALTDILQSRDSNALIDSDVEADDVLTVAENGDLSDTRWMVQKSGEIPGLDNDVVWVENGIPGTDGTGWQHIDDEHTSDIVNQYDSVENSRDVENLLNDAIRNPDRLMKTSDAKAVFVYEVESGKKPVTVYVGSNGFIQSMYPQSVGT
jgi:hypothetical protein